MTRDPDKAAARRIEPVADWLQEVEFRRPPGPPPPAWRDRRHWRWMALLAAVVVLALVLFRQPLADLVWPDMRVQRLLDGAESALAQGRLSAADGSGARQQFEAAQALDSDRGEARQGLARVAAAALAQARVQVGENRFDQARQSLALARELQVPRATADALAEELRQREAARAGLEGMMVHAGAAAKSGDVDTALSLYQRVLALQPTHTAALEGREDALSDLLQQAGQALARGDLAAGAALISRVRQADPGQVELPAAESSLARAIDARRRAADQDLKRKRLAQALAGYRLLQELDPDDAGARVGIERVAAAHAQQAAHAAADFDFDAARQSLDQARALAPRAEVVLQARQALQRARQLQARLASSLPPRERARRTRALLVEMDQAGARGDWLTPPGESAYDKLRAAQALSPEDPAVKRATSRLLPATLACFEDEASDWVRATWNSPPRPCAKRAGWMAMRRDWPSSASACAARRRPDSSDFADALEEHPAHRLARCIEREMPGDVVQAAG
ncbi:MAG: hypothetical protein EOP91_14285 [Lysobacteraceae bacterium]|nr:MAG: hypothetical protein EOP91_14285 [Xanthomonadaceae bacterium]